VRALHIDDMRTIAETPAVLLLPLSLNYSGTPLFTIGSLAVYPAQEYANRHRLMLPKLAPLKLSRSDDRPFGFPVLATIELDRQRLARGSKLTRYSRRQEAREGGRRNARPVPIEQRWEAHVFAEQGTDERTIERAAVACAVLVARSWRRGLAVDWARRNLALRARSERKKGAGQ
jgi:hypothetical protein